MKKSTDITILFVDDEQNLLNSIRRLIRKEPYQKRFANSADEALQLLQNVPVDIIVTDLRMPKMDGIALLNHVKTVYPDVTRMILSATRDMDQTISAINACEAYRFITKPMDPAIFKRTLMDVVEYRLLVENKKETMTSIEKRLLQSTVPRDLKGADIATMMIPSGQLNGDFTDFYRYSSHMLDILIGDVMGKGIQAALVGAGIKHHFAKSLAIFDCTITPRMSCPNLTSDKSMFLQIAATVQRECFDDLMELECFCTLIFLRLNLELGEYSLFDLGHCPLIHYHAKTGNCNFMKSDNMPLGIVMEKSHQMIQANVEPDDILLLYSDGIVEASSAEGELFGEERLIKSVRDNSHKSAANLIEAIRSNVASFCRDNRFEDDVTCIAVRIDGDVN